MKKNPKQDPPKEFLFYGNKDTMTFCLPSCSNISKSGDKIVFNSLCSAYDQKYDPCPFCMPELFIDKPQEPDRKYASVVAKALEDIHNGFLDSNSVKQLADHLFISERQLRRKFIDKIGIPPASAAKYKKAMAAKKLLVFSQRPVADVGLAAGFSSIRQYNDVIKGVFGKTPTAIRKEASGSKKAREFPKLFIVYDEMPDFQTTLEKMKARVIKGVELITPGAYWRTFNIGEMHGFFRVEHIHKANRLEIAIHTCDIRSYDHVCDTIRGVFGVRPNKAKASFLEFEEKVKALFFKILGPENAMPALDLFIESISLKTKPAFPSGMDYFFPGPGHILKSNIEETGLDSRLCFQLNELSNNFDLSEQ